MIDSTPLHLLIPNASVCVQVVPLNSFPSDEAFHAHVEMLEGALHSIPLNSMQVSEPDSELGPFSKLLGQDITIYTKIAPFPAHITDEYHLVQLHRRLLVIVGLTCGNDVAAAASALQSHLQLHQHSCASLIIHCEVAERDGLCLNTASQSADLAEIQSALIGKLFAFLNGAIENYSRAVTIPSPHDLDDKPATGSSASRSSKALPNFKARAQKLIADAHLLTGSYGEAVASYASVVEETKQANDGLWNLAAQEGFYMAHALQTSTTITDPVRYAELLASLAEKLGLISGSYEKAGIPYLALHVQLVISRIKGALDRPVQALNVASESWRLCALMNASEKIYAASNVLQRLSELGAKRKWIYFVNQLIGMLKAAGEYETALQSLCASLTQFSVSEPEFQSWPSLQIATLKEIVEIAEQQANTFYFLLYGWIYLSQKQVREQATDSSHLVKQLKKVAARGLISLDSDSPLLDHVPLLKDLQVVNESVVSPFRNHHNHSHEGPFIYHPVSLSQPADCSKISTVIAKEPFKIGLRFCNPFNFQVNLRQICLITDNQNSYSQEAAQISLTPLEEDQYLELTATCHDSGPVKIVGCMFVFMHMEVSFVTDSIGRFHPRSRSDNLSPFVINVLNPQPLVKFCGDSDLYLNVYEGQILDCEVAFKNIGYDAVDKALASCFTEERPHEQMEYFIDSILHSSGKDVVSVDDAVLADAMPLPPGQTTKLLVKVCGVQGFHLVRLDLQYCSKDQSRPVHWRQASLRLHVNVRPIVLLSDLCFFRSSDDRCIAALMLESVCKELVTVTMRDDTGETKFSIFPNGKERLICFLKRFAEERLREKPQVSQKQLASIRKIRKPDLDDFVEEDFNETLFDAQQYTCRKWFMEAVSLDWDLSERIHGSISFAHTPILEPFYDFITIPTEPLQIQVNGHPLSEAPVSGKLGEEILISFKALAPIDDFSVLTLKPMVLLAGTDYASNFEKAICFTGALQVILRPNNTAYTLKIFPIAYCTVDIICHIRSADGHEKWCKKPVRIKTEP